MFDLLWPPRPIGIARSLGKRGVIPTGAFPIPWGPECPEGTDLDAYGECRPSMAGRFEGVSSEEFVRRINLPR